MQFIKENISTESVKCPETHAQGVPASGHLQTSSVSTFVTHRRDRAGQRRKYVDIYVYIYIFIYISV